MTDREKILSKMDNNFVENYEDMIKYKNNLDSILINMGFKPFKSYNDFCIKVKINTIDFLHENKEITFNNMKNEYFSLIINKTLRSKIKEKKNFNNKLKIYFNNEENVIK